MANPGLQANNSPDSTSFHPAICCCVRASPAHARRTHATGERNRQEEKIRKNTVQYTNPRENNHATSIGRILYLRRRQLLCRQPRALSLSALLLLHLPPDRRRRW